MAVTAAELNVVFAADTSDLKKGGQEAQGILKGIAATAGGMLAAGAFTAAAGGVTDLVRGMVTANASAETMRQSLDIAAGSMQRGGQIFADLQKMAANTPFEFPELMQAAVSLESLGVDAMEYMEVLGNTAAATGKSLDQVTQAFLDAQTGEFERLKEFGIRASVEGEKVLFTYMTAHGQVTKEVEKGNTAMYQSTLESIWNEKYQGAMDQQSKTLMGMWSTLKDNFNLLMQEMGKPLFEFAKAGVAAFNGFFGIFNALRDKGRNVFAALWGGIRRTLKDLLGADNPLFVFIKKGKRLVVDLVEAWREGGLAGVIEVVWSRASGAFVKGVMALKAWIVRTGLPTLMEGLNRLKDKIATNAPGWMAAALTAVQDGWAAVVTWVTDEGVPNLLGALGAFKDDVGPKITQGVTGLINAFISNWPRVLNWLANDGVPRLVVRGAEMVGALVKGVTDNWGTITTWIKDNGWKLVVGALAYPAVVVSAGAAVVIGFMNGLREVWATQLYPWIRETLGWEGWKALFSGAGTWLLDKGTALVQGLSDGLMGRWTDFSNDVFTKKNEITGWFANAGTWLLEAGKAIVQGLWDGVTEKWESFKSDLIAKAEELPGWVKDILGIASPSQVFYEIGADTMEGWRKGIEDGIGKVRGTIALGGGPALGMAGAGARGGGATYNNRSISLTVNTQASDPNAVASAVMGRLYGAMDRVGAGVA